MWNLYKSSGTIKGRQVGFWTLPLFLELCPCLTECHYKARHFSIILTSNTQIISSYLVIFLISLKVTVDCSSIVLVFKGKDIVFYRKLLSTPTSSPTVSRDSPQRRVRIADEDSPQRRVRITDDQPSLHDSYIQRLENLQMKLGSIDSGMSYTLTSPFPSVLNRWNENKTKTKTRAVKPLSIMPNQYGLWQGRN